jgi:hypothetical protein
LRLAILTAFFSPDRGHVYSGDKLDGLPAGSVTVVLVTASRTLAVPNAKGAPVAYCRPQHMSRVPVPEPGQCSRNGIQLVNGGTAECIGAPSTTSSTGCHGRGPSRAVATDCLPTALGAKVELVMWAIDRIRRAPATALNSILLNGIVAPELPEPAESLRATLLAEYKNET